MALAGSNQKPEPLKLKLTTLRTNSWRAKRQPQPTPAVDLATTQLHAK